MDESQPFSLRFLPTKPLIAVFFIFITTFPLSHCEDDDKFNTCSRPYDCGKLNNLSFPFWGSDRPQFCGYPGFQLRCSTGDYPIMEIDGLDYRVLSVSKEKSTMILARLDFWDTPCSPIVDRNTTLNPPSLFNFTEDVVNLTLFYDCPDVDVPCNFTCPGSNGKETYNYYVSDFQLEKFLPLVTGQATPCEGGVVRVAIFRSALYEKPEEGYEQNVSRVLNEGFGVNYTSFPLCKACETSGGRCGTIETQPKKFYCFRHNGTEDRVSPPHTRTFTVSPPPHTRADTVSPPHTRTHTGNDRDWKLIKIAIGTIFGGSALLVIFIVTYRMKAMIARTKNDQDIEAFIRNYGHITAKRYRFSDVKKMTKSFKDKLGQGGYGKVYRGELLDGQFVAVKILNSSKGNGEEFINEVASISRTSHVNIVTLLGFCLEGHRRALIYEYMPNGSLEKFTYKDNTLQTTPDLRWEKLLQISIGIARGLEYLHRGCNAKIIHLDIKPHNILLDEDLCPKISDFGLAKLCPRNDSIMSMTNARGTIGYIAPEMFYRNFGGVSSKSDVYSYGMMILEMVGGRKNVKVGVSRSSEIYFPDWIYKHLQCSSNLQLWREMTSDENEIARKMIIVGLWCIQNKQSDRPSMTKVIKILEGSIETLHIPPNPSMFSSRSPERLPAELLAESSTVSML